MRNYSLSIKRTGKKHVFCEILQRQPPRAIARKKPDAQKIILHPRPRQKIMHTMELSYHAIPYAQLTTDQLYQLLRLRAEVFVVEQDCVYQDLDDKDQQAVHLLGMTEDGRLAAYTRIVPKGTSYPEFASIGRVITASFARGKGLGRPLMRESLRVLFEHYGEQTVKIGAQAHLGDYYTSLGFKGIGDVYDEDGIPHRSMLFVPST